MSICEIGIVDFQMSCHMSHDVTQYQPAVVTLASVVGGPLTRQQLPVGHACCRNCPGGPSVWVWYITN